MSVWTIAGLTFKEAARRKILWAAFLLGLAFLALYGLGLHTLMKSDPQSFSEVNQLIRNQALGAPLVMALYAVNYLTVIMTVLTSSDTIAGEITSGTIQSIITKPIERREILIGKWLGFAGMLTVYLLMMAGGILGETYLLSGYVAPNIAQGLSLMWVESLLLLSITFLFGASFSTLATGVITFGLQSIAFIGGWIEQFGEMIHNQAAVKLGIAASLVMPSESIWRRAVYEMQSPIVKAVGMSPFGSASTPSQTMVIYAIIYGAVAFWLAARRFGRRDL